MSKHFCCCIPVRFGVFVFSLLSAVTAGLLAAILWFIVHEIAIKADGYTNVNERTKIIVIVIACVFSVMALLSLFGFIGSITRNRRFVKAFSFMAWILFFCSLAAAGLLLWAVYTEKNITTDCINSDDKGNVSVDECTTHLSTGMKIAITVIVAVHVFVELYIVTIVRRYVEQLEEEDGWQGPYKLTSTDVSQGLMNTAPNSYPYSDPHHAYGNA